MLHIPTPVVTGDSVVLRCAFELGNETLYAVKWYKNMAEFFRYVPASDPPLKTFPQIGIDVDVSNSLNILINSFTDFCLYFYPFASESSTSRL